MDTLAVSPKSTNAQSSSKVGESLASALRSAIVADGESPQGAKRRLDYDGHESNSTSSILDLDSWREEQPSSSSMGPKRRKTVKSNTDGLYVCPFCDEQKKGQLVRHMTRCRKMPDHLNKSKPGFWLAANKALGRQNNKHFMCVLCGEAKSKKHRRQHLQKMHHKTGIKQIQGRVNFDFIWEKLEKKVVMSEKFMKDEELHEVIKGLMSKKATPGNLPAAKNDSESADFAPTDPDSQDPTPERTPKRKTGDAGESPRTPHSKFSSALPKVETPNVVKRMSIHPSLDSAFEDFAKKLPGAPETRKKKIQQLRYFVPNIIAHLGTKEDYYEKDEWVEALLVPSIHLQSFEVLDKMNSTNKKAKAPVKLTKDVKKQYIKALIDFMMFLSDDQLMPELNYYKTDAERTKLRKIADLIRQRANSHLQFTLEEKTVRVKAKEGQRQKLIPLEKMGQFVLETDWNQMAKDLANLDIDADTTYVETRDKLFTSLFGLTAARPGEVLSLQLSDVQKQVAIKSNVTGKIVLYKFSTSGSAHHSNKTIGKYGSKFLFALPDQTAALNAFVERHKEKIDAAGGSVFVSSRSGKVMSEGSKLVRIAGYEDRSPMDLRRSMITGYLTHPHVKSNHLKATNSSEFARTAQHTDTVQQQAYLLIRDMEPQNAAFIYLKAFEEFKKREYIVYDYINIIDEALYMQIEKWMDGN